MLKYRLANNLTGWLLFLIAATVYLLTLEPTTSLWDCGEFIASAYKLQVGHPPGAPFFMLLARFFSLFAGNNVEKVAMMINGMSALASAFTILFLFWTITHLARRLIQYRASNVTIDNIDETLPLRDKIIILGSGVVGALAYTFSDTFWFSAVEGEVYASSSFFTAIVFWAILKWEDEDGQKQANRWLILIAYLMGLSIGVHLLNLLAIPAIVLVYYFKKYQVTTSGIVKALLISVLLLGSVMYIIIPGVVWLASLFELAFVNGFGLPYNSGVIVYIILLIALLIFGIWKTYVKKQVILNTAILMVTVIIIGYSSYALIIIRSLADPPMDENNPETVFGLQYYLNREQYGDRPLVKGQYFNANPLSINEGKATYTPVDGKYKITNRKLSYNYNPEYMTFFPRMWSSDDEHIAVYLDWGGLEESKMFEPQRDANNNIVQDNNGNVVYDHRMPNNSPGFYNNLRFFISYQVGFMYLRYFMWNFVGRQNDIQGQGDPLNGNWISGIDFVDRILIGNTDKMPERFKDTPSRNKYYFLPLLLGLIGLFFQLQRDNKNFWVVMLLFIMTGFAIVVYLNQTPMQPRERDYAYAGSFYAFAIWIGIGVLALYDTLSAKLKNNFSAVALSVVCLLLVPGIMANENWDDHDRSGRYTTRDFAYNYLNSCAPNAILFTSGDNDTFPLWYAQEVEGIRTDVRIVNLMLLNMDWYIDQMKRKAYESDTLPISMSFNKYVNGTRDYFYIQERTQQPADLKDVIEFVLSDLPQTQLETSGGEKYNYSPTRYFRLPVDRSVVLHNGTVDPADSSKVVPVIEWRFNRNSMDKGSMTVMDILAHNNWVRPIYFASLGHEGTLGLEDYMQLEGFAYRLVPIKSESVSRYEAGRINIEKLYDNLMYNFQWDGINDPDVYLDDFHVRTTSILRIRTRFSQLANELISKGDTVKALEVLNRCMELTPDNKIPFDHTIIQIASAYYHCNDITTANELVEKMGEICIENLEYYLDQNSRFVSNVNDEIIYNFQVLQNMIVLSENNEQNDISTRLDTESSRLYNVYTAKTTF